MISVTMLWVKFQMKYERLRWNDMTERARVCRVVTEIDRSYNIQINYIFILKVACAKSLYTHVIAFSYYIEVTCSMWFYHQKLYKWNVIKFKLKWWWYFSIVKSHFMHIHKNRRILWMISFVLRMILLPKLKYNILMNVFMAHCVYSWIRYNMENIK